MAITIDEVKVTKWWNRRRCGAVGNATARGSGDCLGAPVVDPVDDAEIEAATASLEGAANDMDESEEWLLPWRRRTKLPAMAKRSLLFSSASSLADSGLSVVCALIGVMNALEVVREAIGCRAMECRRATGLKLEKFTTAADAAAAALELPSTNPTPGSEKPPRRELGSAIAVHRSLSLSLTDDLELAGEIAWVSGAKGAAAVVAVAAANGTAACAVGVGGTGGNAETAGMACTAGGGMDATGRAGHAGTAVPAVPDERGATRIGGGGALVEVLDVLLLPTPCAAAAATVDALPAFTASRPLSSLLFRLERGLYARNEGSGQLHCETLVRRRRLLSQWTESWA
jgi:hypothetical protein